MMAARSAQARHGKHRHEISIQALRPSQLPAHARHTSLHMPGTPPCTPSCTLCAHLASKHTPLSTQCTICTSPTYHLYIPGTPASHLPSPIHRLCPLLEIHLPWESCPLETGLLSGRSQLRTYAYACTRAGGVFQGLCRPHGDEHLSGRIAHHVLLVPHVFLSALLICTCEQGDAAAGKQVLCNASHVLCRSYTPLAKLGGSVRPIYVAQAGCLVHWE